MSPRYMKHLHPARTTWTPPEVGCGGDGAGNGAGETCHGDTSQAGNCAGPSSDAAAWAPRGH